MKERKFEILTVTNDPFIPVVSKLLQSFNHYHPEIKINIVCVNVSKNGLAKIKGMHNKLKIIEFNKKFKKFGGPRELGPKDPDHEQGYCTSCRSWYATDIMQKTGKSVLYLDADVYTKGDLTELFDQFEYCDFMIRAKKLKPFTCNAGMVWMKNTENNRKIINEWAEETKKMGISWRSNQWTLNQIIQKYWDEIDYMNFPERYNGIATNKNSVLVHEKGVKLDVRFYNNK